MNDKKQKGISLEQLMRLAQKGDQEAYAALLKSITPVLRAFIINRLGPQIDTEDLLQNILMSIHQTSRTYDSNRSFKAWMFAIARYRLNDYLRQVYKKGTYTEISLNDLTCEISGTDVTSNEERYEHLSSVLTRLLRALPEKQRKIVTMMKLEGHSVEDTARKMNMSISAVKVAAHRAYKTLILKASEAKEKESDGNK